MFENCKSGRDVLIGFLYTLCSHCTTKIEVTTDRHHLSFVPVATQLKSDHRVGLIPFRFDRSLVGHRYYELDRAMETLQAVGEMSYPIRGETVLFRISPDDAEKKLRELFSPREILYLEGLASHWAEQRGEKISAAGFI